MSQPTFTCDDCQKEIITHEDEMSFFDFDLCISCLEIKQEANKDLEEEAF